MMTSVVSHIRKYRAAVWDILLSTIGCFVLRRCFRIVAAGHNEPDTNTTICAVGQARDPLAYVGAALIILALAVKEP
jgi:hypothetical protein